jgi:hypothetical protein
MKIIGALVLSPFFFGRALIFGALITLDDFAEAFSKFWREGRL